MKKSILLLATCAIALVGCQKDKEEGVAIQINANVSTSTKAAVTGTAFGPNLTNVFGVCATVAKGDLSTPFFTQAPVSTDASSKPHFTPAQFYPSTGSLHFYAYAPFDGAAYNGGAQPTVGYDLSTLKGQADIMWAMDDSGYAKGSAGPTFGFTHKLMLFKFTIKGEAGSPVVGRYVKKVELTEQPINASLNIVTGDLTFGSNKSSITAYEAGSTAGIQINESASSEFGCAMIAPSSSSFKVKISFGGSETTSLISTLEATGNLTTPAEGVAGKSHVIAMTMSPKEITLTTSITDWVPGAGGAVSFE